MTPEDWRAAGRYFDYRGRKIFYRLSGQGTPLLCLHGFPTSSWDWYKIWLSLAKRYQVIAADMIGFGFSDKPADYHYSIHDQADLQEALLQSLGIHECHILAHDYGDSVAQEMLARFLEQTKDHGNGLKIHSVCFLNGGLFPGQHRPRLIQKLLLSPIGGFVARLLNKDRFRKSFSAVFGPDTQPASVEIDNFWQIISHNGGHVIANRLMHYMTDRLRHQSRWETALTTSTIPLRLIDGALDPVSGRHLANYYREAVPAADVVLFENAGHYPQVEVPQKTLEAYLDFRSRIDSISG